MSTQSTRIDKACRDASASSAVELHTYSTWSTFLQDASGAEKKGLVPHLGLVFSDDQGSPFLLHAADENKPVCLAILPSGPDAYRVRYEDASWVTTRDQLLCWFETATDASVMVSFHLDKQGAEVDSALLNMKVSM